MFASLEFSPVWIAADLDNVINSDSGPPFVRICSGQPPTGATGQKFVTVRLGFEEGYKPKE